MFFRGFTAKPQPAFAPLSCIFDSANTRATGQRKRHEEACYRRPADPTRPGDAADLSIMGQLLKAAKVNLNAHRK